MSEQYSHRNGETEPPTERGLYWYHVEYFAADDDEPTIFRHLFIITPNVNKPGNWWAFNWRRDPSERARDAHKLRGQWWGPVILPWDVTP